MTEQEIIDGNMLIAKFMGAMPHRNGEIVRFPKSMKGYVPEHLKYHSSWSWLMPVVEKIESDKIARFEIFDCAVWVFGLPMVHPSFTWFSGITEKDKKGCIYLAVVNFLKNFYKIGAPIPSMCDATGAPSEKIPLAT